MYDEFHFEVGDSFKVNQKLDGNDTQYHLDGIVVIKEALIKGRKTRPILVYQDDTKYRLLDGFKRSRAYLELEYPHIEAFVCTMSEFLQRKKLDNGMTAYKGGQPFEKFGLYEGSSEEEIILSWDKNPEHIRIEVAENIHVHWGSYGKYRLDLGRRDFELLAQAIGKI